MKTGVFFHEIFARHSWPVVGNRFKNFPKAMERELQLEKVDLFKPEKVSEELLLKVHSREHLDRVKERWYYEGAAISVGGCIEASELVYDGKIENALVFNVAAGHHARHENAWGGTYLSCTGPSIADLREKVRTGKKLRFAIIDTDSHHGDGTRSIFRWDKDVLHICFCSNSKMEDETKIDVDVGFQTTDEAYLRKVEEELPRIKAFHPEMIFHILGYDTCEGDYGDRGLTKDFFLKLVELVRSCSIEACGGRYVIIIMGGSRGDIAEYIFPRMIRILAK